MSSTYLARILSRQLRILAGDDITDAHLDAIEGMLISDAIDELVDAIDHHAPAGWALYYDESTVYWERNV